MIEPQTRNVTRAYRAASDDDRAYGARWYGEAHALALDIASGDVARGAGVIAALSPRLQWTANVNAARRAFAQGYASGVLGSSAGKADAILAGAAPLDVLGGRKVRAFYECILTAGDTDAVCVDMHAFNIAVGTVTPDGGGTYLSRVGAYDRVALAYIRAGERLSVRPCEVQAATWVFWRRTCHRRGGWAR